MGGTVKNSGDPQVGSGDVVVGSEHGVRAALGVNVSRAL